MKQMIALFLFLFSCSCMAQDDIEVPDGFVLQPLAETDGQIARPKDWFFSSEETQSGWLWTISKEKPVDGFYETGMRIQLLLGVAKGTGQSRQQFVQDFISSKRHSAEVMRDCPKRDLGEFYRQCIEVLESAPTPSGTAKYRVLYSLMWAKKLDMVVVSIFGAPPETWEAAAPVADAMAEFRLIGPKFGK